MKRISLLIIIFAMSLSSEAKVWRINNNPGIDADFTSFSSAQNTANNGDTLYFEGSVVSYGNIALSKKLTIIGPGYFLTENPETQAVLSSAKFGSISFNQGGEGSSFMGLEIHGIVTISLNQISIERCLIWDRISINSSTQPIGNTLILNNYIFINSYTYGINQTGNNPVYNLIISHNFIRTYDSRAINLNENVSGVLSNNIFQKDVWCYNFIFTNNIQTDGISKINNNIFFNNIGNSNQFPIGNNNQQNINMVDVFVGVTGQSTDGQWQLKAGSPAIASANNGGDCGIFGDPTPYVLSGMPAIPAVFEINMPASGNNIDGIPVTIKVKSH